MILNKKGEGEGSEKPVTPSPEEPVLNYSISNINNITITTDENQATVPFTVSINESNTESQNVSDEIIQTDINDLKTNLSVTTDDTSKFDVINVEVTHTEGEERIYNCIATIQKKDDVTLVDGDTGTITVSISSTTPVSASINYIGNFSSCSIDISSISNPIELLDTAESTTVEFTINTESQSKDVPASIIESDIQNLKKDLSFDTNTAALKVSNVNIEHTGNRNYKCTASILRDSNISMIPGRVYTVTISHPSSTDSYTINIKATHISSNKYHVFVSESIPTLTGIQTSRTDQWINFKVDTTTDTSYWGDLEASKEATLFFIDQSGKDVTNLFEYILEKGNVMGDPYCCRAYIYFKEGVTTDDFYIDGSETTFTVIIYHPDAVDTATSAIKFKVS